MPPVAVPDLTKEERSRYVMKTTTMDHGDPEFARWMNERGLMRQKGEQTMQFAHRAFSHFIENGKYGGDTSSYESRRPSLLLS